VKFLFQNSTVPTSHYLHRTLCGVDYPHPVLERGWLHGRQLKLAWDIDRIAAKMGDRCWLSHYDNDSTTHSHLPRLTTLAGYWPSGGFIEVLAQNTNSLEDHPRRVLAVYAATSAEAETILAKLLAGYLHGNETSTDAPRIGILNHSHGSLEVQRISISTDQTVKRDQLALYYGAGMPAWVDRWLELIHQRRYGLTVLTGTPGTGKTTLIRSLAQWLCATHMFYFMPAARFVGIESGDIVSFWADENRHSKLRKILILEDAESVLQRRAEDNREKVASLLNLTDGMMGDALGLHVVCTLNCDLSDLDPALLRPGRLIGQRELGPLPVEEAHRLATHLGRPLPAGVATIAEILHGQVQPTVAPPVSRRRLGFYHQTA